MRQALGDLRVVEVGTGVAAQWCGKVFADLGADVVKVEPPGGDPARRSQPARFAHLNTNKSSVAIGGGTDAAALVWAQLAGADLVVEAPGRGALADWGIERDEVVAELDGTSVVAITGWGLTGPYAHYQWSDLVAQAFSGALLHDLTRGPLRLPVAVAECAVGHTAAVGALGAVLRARASGVGAVVDVAAVEALASVPARIQAYLGWEYRGREALDAAVRASRSGRTLLPNAFFPCADGDVCIMMTTQQLSEMLAVLDSPELSDAFAHPEAFLRTETKEILDTVLYSWLLDRTRAEVTVAAQAAGWPVTGVLGPDEVLAADHYHQRGFWQHATDDALGPVMLPGAPYRLSEGGWMLRRPAPRLGDDTSPSPRSAPAPARAGASPDAEAPPLRGVRVLDFTTVYSGPFLTLMLADLGAEVIRVESPLVFPPTTRGLAPRPDANMILGASVGSYAPVAPGSEDRPWNRHAMYNSVNRGKRSVTLDVRFAEQRELFLRLVAESDVFVENLKASTLHQIGVHETDLLEANPRLVVVRIPPAGLSGDWAHYTGFGGQFDALTGFASLAGHSGTEVSQTPITMHMDSVTGPAGAFAILAALHYRDATGRGQLVEFAQSENVVSQLGEVYVDLQLGNEHRRQGNRDPHQAPQGLYECADGRWLAVTVTGDPMWPALARVLGREDLLDSEELSTLAGRQANHEALDAAIADWAATVDAVDGFAALQEAGVAAAPIVDDGMLASDPQMAAREWIRPLPSSDVGSFNHLGHAFRGIPLEWGRGAPVLGEDNEYVFREILGLDDDEYRRLVSEGVATEYYLDSRGNPY